MVWNDRLGKWLGSMELASDKVVDFGTADVPVYIQELLRWEVVGGCATGGVFLAAAILFAIIVIAAYRASSKAASGQDKDGYAFLCFASASVAMCLCAASLYNFSQALKAYTAPRVVLVEKLQEYLKQNRK